MKLKIIIAVIIAIVFAILFWVEPIPQDLNYHLFADTISRWGVNNFWNVMSNFPFILVGILGLFSLAKNRLMIAPDNRLFYWLFFCGIIAVGLGSGWYHLNPNNESLVWDRLPMTVAFMAFFAVILAEHVDELLGRRLLWPLIGLGLLSIFYWHYSESVGAGDLRWYGLVQFLPLIMIPIIFILYPKKYSHSYLLWLFLGMYLAAKLLEFFDNQLFQLLSFISGHSLKHMAAALGIYFYWCYLKFRKEHS